MKKKTSLEQNRVRQSRASGIRKAGLPAVPKSKGVKLTPSRRKDPAGLLEESLAEDREAHAVSFEYFNPSAREVCVAGCFNGWQPSAMPMTRLGDGKWWTEALLQPGHYEYRLVVDGQWQDDPMAARFVANSFGGLNCVIEVKPMSLQGTSRP